MVSRRAPA